MKDSYRIERVPEALTRDQVEAGAGLAPNLPDGISSSVEKNPANSVDTPSSSETRGKAAPVPVNAGAVRKRLAIVFSLFSLYLIWGSTYLGMRISLEGFPPFLLSGIRFLIAGGILYAVLRLRGVPSSGRKEWAAANVLGVRLCPEPALATAERVDGERGADAGRRCYFNPIEPGAAGRDAACAYNSSYPGNGFSDTVWIARCFQRLWLPAAERQAGPCYQLRLRQPYGGSGAGRGICRGTYHSGRTAGHADYPVRRGTGLAGAAASVSIKLRGVGPRFIVGPTFMALGRGTASPGLRLPTPAR